MPSAVFQRLWVEIERRRVKKKIKPKVLAEKSGFKRASWYVYKKKGNIPFDLLERLAAELDGRIKAEVVGLSSVRNATKRLPARPSREGDVDYLDHFQDMLDRFPDEQHKAMAFALMRAAAEEALHKMPPFEDAATGEGAPRSRKK